MTLPEVTILLPVFNSAPTLEATLTSVYQQSFSNFELLIIDDGSEDETPEILESHRKRDPRIRVILHPKRLRLAGALNRGLSEARSEFIARMDADDIAHPKRIETQRSFMQKHPELVMCGTATRHFGLRTKKKAVYPTYTNAIRAFSMFNCPFAHPTVMLRKSHFDAHTLQYDAQFYPTEDFELWTRVVHEAPCANLPEVLLDYRVHETSMTGSDWTNMDEQAARLLHRQLVSLGFSANTKQVCLHRDIGMARVPPERLSEAANWLESLQNTNQTLQALPPDAWGQELRTRWFETCMNASTGGKTVYHTFASSSLFDADHPVPFHQRALLTASILRRGRTGP